MQYATLVNLTGNDFALVDEPSRAFKKVTSSGHLELEIETRLSSEEVCGWDVFSEALDQESFAQVPPEVPGTLYVVDRETLALLRRALPQRTDFARPILPHVSGGEFDADIEWFGALTKLA